MDIIRVSATSRSSAVAGAIAGVIREHKRAEVQAIGAGAVNQAIKALMMHIHPCQQSTFAITSLAVSE